MAFTSLSRTVTHIGGIALDLRVLSLVAPGTLRLAHDKGELFVFIIDRKQL